MFSGPCTGKSVLRADTFSLFKKNNLNVEEVHEVAKDFVWDQRDNMFIEQDVILANQYWLLRRLVLNGVQYAITDTSLLLGFIYSPDDYYPTFFDHMLALYNSFNNVNIFLRRSSKFEYQQTGRNETEEQAWIKDGYMADVILANKIPHHILDAGDPTNPQHILDICNAPRYT